MGQGKWHIFKEKETWENPEVDVKASYTSYDYGTCFRWKKTWKQRAISKIK
jgi:hypothetical protein